MEKGSPRIFEGHGAHPGGEVLLVPDEPLKETGLQVDLEVALEAEADEDVVAGLHRPEGGRGEGVGEGDPALAQPLTQGPGLETPHSG